MTPVPYYLFHSLYCFLSFCPFVLPCLLPFVNGIKNLVEILSLVKYSFHLFEKQVLIYFLKSLCYVEYCHLDCD